MDMRILQEKQKSVPVKRTKEIVSLRKTQKTKKSSCQMGLIPVMLPLYDSIMPDLRADLDQMLAGVCSGLLFKEFDLLTSPIVSSREQMAQAVENFERQKVDVIVVSHLCYAPSGMLTPALLKTRFPLLLWPIQSLAQINPETYSSEAWLPNHGVHGTMDLANQLKRKGRQFAVIHGHYASENFITDFEQRLSAASMISGMQKCNPVVIGNRFEDMMDLRLEDESFIHELGLKPNYINLNEFIEIAATIEKPSIENKKAEYKAKYNLKNDLKDDLVVKTARHELALRALLRRHESTAIGINFVNVCNRPEIADALHVPASVLMAEGFGYGAEGDWETASLMRGLQKALGNSNVSFTEIFTAGFNDNRLALKHWGEGNVAMARDAVVLTKSTFNDALNAEFAICEFEFQPGPVTLINMNASDNSRGQLISISGHIEQERLPKCDGVRGLFKPSCNDVCELLNDYATFGGSHHLVMVKDGLGKTSSLLDNVSTLCGWKHIRL
jgi:L-arabinose isomerase